MKRAWLVVLACAGCGGDGDRRDIDAPPTPPPPADAAHDAAVDAAAVVCLDAGIAPCNATTFPNACQAIEGARFRSVEPRECGQCGQDAGTCCDCQWTIRFATNTFEWVSDQSAAGTFACEQFEIQGMVGATMYSGSFDNACGLLTWDGVVYERY